LKNALRLHARRANRFLIEHRGAFDGSFARADNVSPKSSDFAILLAALPQRVGFRATRVSDFPPAGGWKLVEGRRR